MTKKKALSKINPVFLNGIAHRGLHDEQTIENSLGAFKKAIDAGVAFEFDVHLTKDNELVVCHDEDLKRTTGKEGIIEDLTLKEIKANYRLLSGEEVPTLREVLELNNEQVPMVLELKVFRLNYKPLAKRVKQELKKYIKNKENLLLISFDPRSLWPFAFSGYVRSLLVAKSDEYTYKYKVTVGGSVDLEKVLFNEDRVKKYSRKHFINAWTIESVEDLEEILPYVDTVTYQYLNPSIVKEKLNNK